MTGVKDRLLGMQRRELGQQQEEQGWGGTLQSEDSDVIRDLQNHKLARSQRQNREQGEADDETGGGSQITKGEYQHPVPSTYYTPC